MRPQATKLKFVIWLILFSIVVPKVRAQTYVESDVELIGFNGAVITETVKMANVTPTGTIHIRPFDVNTPLFSGALVSANPPLQFGGGVWADLPDGRRLENWQLQNSFKFRMSPAVSGTTLPTEAVNLFMWPVSLLGAEKADHTFALTAASVFSFVLVGSTTDVGRLDYRFVIQNGDKFYISETGNTNASGTITLSDFVNNSAVGKRWAEFNPSAFPKSISGLTFSSLTPDNVKSVGLYTSSYKTSGSHYFTFSSFTCNGTELVPDQPSVDAIADQPSFVADQGQVIVPFTGLEHGLSANDIISATAVSSDLGIAPNPTVILNNEKTGGEIRFTPTNTHYGTITITLKAQDNGGTAGGRIDTVKTSFTIEIVNPDLPEAGLISDKEVFIGSGQNVVLLPGLSDGGNGTQTLTIEAVSSNPSLVEVVSATFDSDNTFGVLNISEKGTVGTATITVTISDADGSITRDFDVSVVPYTNYGVNFSVVDAAFWNERDVLNDVPVYKEIRSLAKAPSLTEFDWNSLVMNSSSGCSHPTLCKPYSMATEMLLGYIIPPVSGNYIFYIYANDDKSLKLSTDASFSHCRTIAQRSDAGIVGVYDETTKTATSDFVALEAGKPYAMYGLHWYVFSPEKFQIEWQIPGGSREIIQSPNIIYMYDIEKPTAPDDLDVVSYSSSKIIVSWSEASDNDRLAGYNLYVNGELWNNQPIKSAGATITGLDANTQYSMVVTALDGVGNESQLSEVLNVTTWPVDNTPPQAPTGLTTLVQAPMALKIGWNPAVDETAIFGYNVFIDGEKYNADVLTDTFVVVSPLEPETNYSVEVESLDAGENTAKSAPYAAETSAFNPLADNLGVKTGRMNIELEAIGAFDGFGLHTDDGGNVNLLQPAGSMLLKDFEPAIISWGGIQVNPFSLSSHSGTAAYTIADFFSFGVDTLENCCLSFACGVKETTDWVTDKNTFLNFMEYIGGDASTTWGAKRAAEGYQEPFIPRMKHLIFNFGVETWGSTHSVAPALSTRDTYTKWAKEMEDMVKSSPYYDPEKITFGYSMRNPDPAVSWGVNEAILPLLDTAHSDYMNLGGYLGANVGDGADVGGQQMDYFKNLQKKVADNINGLKFYNGLSLEKTGEVKKTYLYETNIGNQAYYGKMGHSIPVIDHGLAAVKHGSVYPTLFALASSQWALVAANKNYKRLPIFLCGKFVNEYSKGQLLQSDYETTDAIYTPQGTKINNKPVGSYLFVRDTVYNVILTSRDYENVHYVQINLPDELNYKPQSLKYYVFTADSLNSEDAYIDTLEITEISDGMIVEVPEYSMVVLSFIGDDLDFDRPLGYVEYVRQEGITLSAETTVITKGWPGLRVSATVTPTDALAKTAYWKVTSDDGINVVYTNSGSSIVISSVDKSGTFKVKASLLDNPAVFDEMTFTVNLSNSVSQVETAGEISLYPNPADDLLNLRLPNDAPAKIRIFDVSGKLAKVFSSQASETAIDVSGLQKGIYFIEVEQGTVYRSKFMLQ